jgi:hypothetical protein
MQSGLWEIPENCRGKPHPTVAYPLRIGEELPQPECFLIVFYDLPSYRFQGRSR